MKKTIAQETEELARLDVAQLLERYEQLFGRPPRVRNRQHLFRRCAWKLQEIRLGGLSQVAKDRLEELISEIELPPGEEQRTVVGKLKKPRRPDDPPVGTVLVREWHGKRIEVRVVEGGFEYESTVYRTLSETARAITGAHWNGKLFFGLAKRKREK